MGKCILVQSGQTKQISCRLPKICKLSNIYLSISNVYLYLSLSKSLSTLSLEEGIFPDDLKTTKVTPIFKAGDENDFGNYQPISVLSCFSKILKKIMYKRLFNHLLEHNLLYQKQFSFRQGHSTEHAIMQPIDQINDKFENSCFTLGIFIDLSKAFDTVNQTPISKLKNCEVKGKKLNLHKSQKL